MEGWVDLGYPEMHRPGVELAIFRSLVRRPTTTPPSQPQPSLHATCVYRMQGVVWSLMSTLLQIYCGVCRWKTCKHRSTSDAVRTNTCWFTFLEHPCTRYNQRNTGLGVRQESPAVADKPARRCGNPGHGSLKGIESDTIRLLAYGFLLPSYSRLTFCLKCTVFEIWRHVGRKSPKNLPHSQSHLAPSLGWPLANFSTSHTLPESETMGLSEGVHFFALLDIIPVVTDGRTRRCRKDYA